ncbi:tetratricopeptide repeat protein [Sphingobacterium sp. Mn56C]|uniref:tetratricopeptide repeat protein n=1 Tax=Sphingobacterium sp. Mn56C TaxID=3395261 RepID=UPI003BEE6792
MRIILNHLILIPLFFCLAMPLHGQTPAQQILQLKSSKAQLDTLLNVNWLKTTKRDTSSLAKDLSTLSKHTNPALSFGYHLLMADAASVNYDRINPRSDLYFQKAEDIAQAQNNILWKIVVAIRKGTYYFTYRDIQHALPHFLLADRLLADVSIQDLPNAATHLQYIANFYGYIGDSKKALNYYKHSANLLRETNRKAVDITNSIGVYYLRDSNINAANAYFDKALSMAQAIRDTVWIGIVKGYIAKNYLLQKDTTKALELFKINADYSLKYQDFTGAMSVLMDMAQVYYQQRNFTEAEKCILQAQVLMEAKPFYLPYKTAMYKMLLEMALLKGNTASAVEYLKKYMVFNDSLSLQKDAERLQQITWKWEAERYDTAFKMAEDKRKKDRILDLSIGLILMLIFLLFILIISRSRQKIKIKSIKMEKERLNLIIEKQQVDKELSMAKKTMEDFITRINNHQNLIQNLQNKLVKAKSQDQDNVTQLELSLNQMLESHIMTDERWLRFKSIFEKLHPGFFSEQRKLYPNISESNLRLLTLNFLGLSNQSISHLLGISLDGVKKAKQRLRKKIVETHQSE